MPVDTTITLADGRKSRIVTTLRLQTPEGPADGALAPAGPARTTGAPA